MSQMDQLRDKKHIIILMGVLLVLVGIAQWDDWKTEQERSQEQTQNRLLTLTDDSTNLVKNITEIKYQNKDISLTLSKEKGIWSITSPLVAEADQNSVAQFLKSLSDYQYEKEIAPLTPENATEFGLENPDRTITVFFSDPKTPEQTILIGNPAPVGYEVYSALKGGRSIFIGSQYLLTLTAKTLLDFRDKDMPDIPISEISQVSFKNKKGEFFALKEDSDGLWFLQKTEPIEKTDPPSPTWQADQNKIKDLFDEFNKLKALDFRDDMAQNNTLTQAMVSVETWTWQSTGENLYSIDFLAESPASRNELWVRYNGQWPLYKINGTFLDKINKELSDFRNKQIFDFESNEISILTLNGKEYTKKDIQDSRDLRSFSVDLAFAKADAFYSLEDPYAKKIMSLPPIAQVQVTLDTGKAVSIKIWNAASEDNQEKPAHYIFVEGAADLYQMHQTSLKLPPQEN